MRYAILTDDLIDEIDAASPEDQGDYLILSESETFPGYWEVEGFDSDFFYDFEEILGRYRILSPARLDWFLDVAEEKNYRPVFVADPGRVLAEHEALNAEPPFALNSSMENTVKGFIPWQVVGFNKLVRSELPTSLAVWDTGTGKTALTTASLKYYEGRYDLAVVVAKTHNKIDTQRKLMRLGDLDSVIIDGTPKQRYRLYESISTALDYGKPVIVITNYEKFRDNDGIWDTLLRGRRCLFYWDEMPTKLSSRTTQLYKSVRKALYEKFPSEPRPSWMRHLILSATPIENDPDGLYSYLNLCSPRTLGTVADFHNAHVVSRNFYSGKPERWRDLDKIEAQLDHMTHRVSKADPDVAAMFPEVIRDEVTIDWDPSHRKLYDRFTSAAKDLLKEETEGINEMALIQVLQMLCDAPSMIKASASNREAFLAALEDCGDAELPTGVTGSQTALELLRTIDVDKLTDAKHTKLDAFREIICEKHPDEKIVVHSTWASYIFPVWEQYLAEWGVPYVIYSGTDKAKQEALDAFREDPSIRVFLSGDAGADSIDIAEATVGINYNMAWKWTTMKQREGRRDRVNSTHETIYTYTLSMANSVEDRKASIIEQKRAYHEAIFEGRAVEGALSARLSADDLRFMLFGDTEDLP